MNPALAIAIEALIRATATEFISWQERRRREAGYVPSQADVDAFMAEISADTPAAIRAQIAKEKGVSWTEPGTQPPAA